MKNTQTNKKENFTPTYKLHFEPILCVPSALSPRYHITKSRFDKIKEQRISEIGGKYCEGCGSIPEDSKKLHLHESFHFQQDTFYFDGFYFLCHNCHEAIHCILISWSGLELEINNILSALKNKKTVWPSNDFEYLMEKKAFASTNEMYLDLYKAVLSAFEFSLCENPKCDYSKVRPYGLNPDDLERKFLSSPTHAYRKVMHMIKLYKGDNPLMKYVERIDDPDLWKPYNMLIEKAFDKNTPYGSVFHAFDKKQLKKYLNAELSEGDKLVYQDGFTKHIMTSLNIDNGYIGNEEGSVAKAVENQKLFREKMEIYTLCAQDVILSKLQKFKNAESKVIRQEIKTQKKAFFAIFDYCKKANMDRDTMIAHIRKEFV